MQNRWNHNPHHGIGQDNCRNNQQEPCLGWQVVEVRLHGILYSEIRKPAGLSSHISYLKDVSNGLLLRIIEEFANQPDMSEWIGHSPLQHPPDRPWPGRWVLMLLNGTMFYRAGANGMTLGRDRIIDE